MNKLLPCFLFVCLLLFVVVVVFWWKIWNQLQPVSRVGSHGCTWCWPQARFWMEPDLKLNSGQICILSLVLLRCFPVKCPCCCSQAGWGQPTFTSHSQIHIPAARSRPIYSTSAKRLHSSICRLSALEDLFGSFGPDASPSGLHVCCHGWFVVSWMMRILIPAAAVHLLSLMS